MTTARSLYLLLFLLLMSGAAALMYEVLWLKQLGRLFGVTAHAAATTLAVFFLGLSAGSLFWGHRSKRLNNPLRVYAWLEFGIGVTAVLYFGLVDLYEAVYGFLYAQVGDQYLLFLLVKFLLAAIVLFPPAFFMGGTLPVLGQFIVRRSEQLGRLASLLYAVNTIGAATGVILAGFILPARIGFFNSYMTAISLNIVVGIVAYVWGRRIQTVTATETSEMEPVSRADSIPLSIGAIRWLAILSGFATLALEVLWTRMYAQVLQNSVFTFSIILSIFLLALSLGSGVARILSARNTPPRATLFWLLTISGVAVGVVPALFYALNPDLQLLGADLGWGAYIATVLGQSILVLLIPGVAIGTIFPYLLKLSERHVRNPGWMIGHLSSMNTVAAIVGSLLAGFVLLELFGLWTCLRLIAVLYFIVALTVFPFKQRRLQPQLAVPVIGAVAFALFITYGNFVVVTVDSRQNETVVEVYEGAQGTVVVTERQGNLRMKLNNSYALGSSAAAINERIQGWLPFCLHPDPKSTFFLGLGTGITAGAALDFDIDSLTVCELNSDVVTASREHFSPYVNGLFNDSRARVINEDGRTFLAATDDRYDVIVADIFLPYKAGVGELYTLEHFEEVRSRLKPGGMFVQWLALFDFSEHEFNIVSRTMTEVFPHVTVWRRGFSAKYSVYALIGSMEPHQVNEERKRRHIEQLVADGALQPDNWLANLCFATYVGNLNAIKDQLATVPLNTEDRTIIEYSTPITERKHRGSGEVSTLAFVKLAEWLAEFRRLSPFPHDPVLQHVSDRGIAEAEAGLAYQTYESLRAAGLEVEAARYLQSYQRIMAPYLSPEQHR